MAVSTMCSVTMILSSHEVALGQGEAASVFGTRDTAGIVSIRTGHWVNSKLHRLGRVLGVRIERMLTGVEDSEHVHFGAELNRIARLGISTPEAHAPLGVD